ncbi:Flp pilus assembly protein CpaB [Desulfosediminicola sp.]|uniref:Flp pilus assembly protein CpaB n=1 Tax=Desulfosediminicola sp. TaxID=2886825 RepID=UPI003AF266FB
MNRIARFAFLLFSLVVAVGISYYVYLLLNRQPAAVVDEAAGVKTTTISVAAQDIPRGHKLLPEDVRTVAFLAESLPQGTFPQDHLPVGRVAIKSIQATEPILENKLAPEEVDRGGLAVIIAPQKRAISVKVDQVIGVAGFIQPGQMVDVLVSIESQNEKAGYITKTVLQNVLILATGTQDQESADDKKAKKINVVTLEVTPEESENLALAVSKGRIVLALRGYTDMDDVLTKGATVPELLRRYRTDKEVVTVAALPNAPKPQRAPVYTKKKFVFEVMNGNKVNSVTLEGR